VIVTAGVIHSVAGWLYHTLVFTWQDPGGYNFVSGPLPNITLIAAAVALMRHHNCHARGCWRLGRHPVDGTRYIVCRHHHPNAGAPSAEEIHAAHAAAQSTMNLTNDPQGTTTSPGTSTS
jgi:hypothetical protein